MALRLDGKGRAISGDDLERGRDILRRAGLEDANARRGIRLAVMLDALKVLHGRSVWDLSAAGCEDEQKTADAELTLRAMAWQVLRTEAAATGDSSARGCRSAGAARAPERAASAATAETRIVRASQASERE